MLRQVTKAEIHLSLKRLLAELDAIREVVNIYPRTRGKKTERKQTVLTKILELQQRLMSILGIEKENSVVLG